MGRPARRRAGPEAAHQAAVGDGLRNALKKDRPEWLTELSVWVLEFAAVDAAAAAGGFLAGRTMFPKFAKKGKSRERWNEWGNPCRLEPGTLRLPKIGRVRIASPDRDQAKLRRLVRRGRARITSVTIARHADDTRWASCKVEQQLPTPAVLAPGVTPVVGVDRGIKTAAVAATADGRPVLELEAGRYLRKTSRKLARAQHTVARRTVRGTPSSANRKEAVALAGRLHERVAQQRKNALHTYSAALVKDHPVLVLETLATKNLMGNRHLARSIGDEGWGELGRQLTYKGHLGRRRRAARAQVLPIVQDVFGVWLSEIQAEPVRAPTVARCVPWSWTGT